MNESRPMKSPLPGFPRERQYVGYGARFNEWYRPKRPPTVGEDIILPAQVR